MMSCAAIGTCEEVKTDLGKLIARTGADEIIVSGQIFDHTARLRSFAIAAEALAAAPIAQAL